MEDTIMKYESTLPRDFDGVFRFTNWTDEDFVGVWSKKEYHFPANSTSPMLIPEHSPLEIQHIRKKFARDLAEREFFKSKKYEVFRKPEGEKGDGTINPRLNSIHQASTYTLNDLTEYIQKCLKPLEVKQAFVVEVNEVPLEEKLSKNDDGEIQTGAIKSDKDLERLANGKLTLKDKKN